MSWNKTTAVNYAKSHANSHSQGRCAEFTRKAIQAGDVIIIQPYEGGNPSGHMALFDGQEWYSDLDNVIGGRGLAIGRQNRHTPFTGSSNESVLVDCSGFVT